MKSPAIVIPTLNEELSIGRLLDALTTNRKLAHIIIVDDHSTDKTGDIVATFSKADPRITYIDRQGPRSFALSYRDGFSLAISRGADCVIQMDADGSHPPSSIDAMLDALEQYDIVIGSRFVPGGEIVGRSVARNAISRIANRFARQMLHMAVRDVTSGFTGWRTSVIKTLHEKPFLYRNFVILIWMKQQTIVQYRWKEIPIRFHDRTHGASKFTWKTMAEGALAVFQMRSTIPSTAKKV